MRLTCFESNETDFKSFQNMTGKAMFINNYRATSIINGQLTLSLLW